MQLHILGPWVSAPLDAVGANPSYLVADGGGAYCLFDCGAGAIAQLQALRALPQLAAIVVSHMHHDHYMDLFPLANMLYKHGLRVKLYVPDTGGRSKLEAAVGALFDGGPRFGQAFDIAEYGARDRLTVGGLALSFHPTVHTLPCYAARIACGGKTIVYTADTEYFPGLARFAQGTDLLLCEATYPDAETHPGHMTGEQAGRVAAEAEAGRLVLTHLRHDGAANARIREQAQTAYRGTIDLAATGAVYRV